MSTNDDGRKLQDFSGPAYAGRLCGAFEHLQNEAKRLTAESGGVFKPGSQAVAEHSSYPRPSAVISASSIAVPLIEMGAEHLSVFAKILVEPVEGMAAWTCVRSMLESCGIATWLLDPTIDALARASRVFAIRYQGVREQLKFARASNQPTNSVESLKARLDAVTQEATGLGFSVIFDRNAHRIGVAEPMPSATEMIQQTLGEGTMYRILSAIAHGHYWAIQQLCYVADDAVDGRIGDTNTKAFRKEVRVDRMAVLASCAVRAFFRSLWNQCRYFGWDQLKFEELFEEVADRIQIRIDRRFWRSYPTDEPGSAEGV